ncbi:unnamed protein product [Mytilus coruscus]|uniref:Tyr recombinase domain-containing protein n=1 Tax=Mytilus coruscus TaxID=42192 RepID=A0A6J8C6H0_MYTCO|nr:unnamed protein product [Mytilus coruscus]
MMYTTGTDRCPVKSFVKYLKKHNYARNRLFLHLKNSYSEQDDIWFRNEPIGPNPMKVFMKNLSKSTKISREYTNHCIRSTCITLLDYCGFQSRHIMTISGHRNEASLSSYCYDTSDKQKKSMSVNVPMEHYNRKKSRSVTICLSKEKTVSTFTSDKNAQPMPVIESVSAVENSKRQVETAPYDPDIIDFLGLPDVVLVDYCQSIDNSEQSTSAPKQMKMMPLRPTSNISNCTVKISYRLAFRRSFSGNFYCDEASISSLLSGGDPLVCLYGCSGNIITSMSYYCTDYSVDEDWSSGERTVVYTFPVTTSNIYHFGYKFCLDRFSRRREQVVTENDSKLTVRSDTGTINSSPISAMKPITRMKQGCQYSIQIPVQDDDSDIVKCRWSTKTRYDECGGVCQRFTGSVLDEVSCVLHYNAIGRTGWYAVAVQIEDFAVSNNMVPLSSVPLQFLVQVFTSSGYCEDRPVLVETNFIDGTNFHISLYSTLCEIMVARSATNTSRIIEIITVYSYWDVEIRFKSIWWYWKGMVRNGEVDTHGGSNREPYFLLLSS